VVASEGSEHRFELLLGRLPSDDDRRRLLAVREALGIHPNDALWDVLIALDYHQQLYSAMPKKIAESIEGSLGELNGAAATLAKLDVAKLEKLLARAEKSRPPATEGAAVSGQVGVARLAFWGVLGVALGAVCISAGYLMALRGGTPWGKDPLGMVLGAPAGWLMFLLMMPPAIRWGRKGWGVARSSGEWAGRLTGWLVLLGSCGLIAMGLVVLVIALRR
jgi:hypothetical protein